MFRYNGATAKYAATVVWSGERLGLFYSFDALEFFAGFEADGFAGRDADFFAGARVASDAGFAGLDAEDAEAAEFDAISMFEGFLHRFEDRLHGHFGLGFGNTGLVNDFVDDI